MAACVVALLPLLWRAAEVAVQVRQDHLAAVAYRHGIALQREQRYDEAASAFREAIAASPRATAVYLALGEAEFKRGNTDEAAHAYRQLMAIYPYAYFAELHRQVGLIELRGGRLEAAVTDLRQAVALDPGDWLAYHFLGHAYRGLGDLPSARAAWERAVLVNPDFQPSREQLRRLDAQSP